MARIAAFALVIAMAIAAQAIPLTINTQFGQVVGFQSPIVSEVAVWWGIPFAAPPTGNLRWQPPQDPISWGNPLNCTNRPPICAQNKNKNSFSGQEDCLTLDVYVPINATSSSNLPVMVFVHGGGFTGGDSLGDPTIPGVTTTLYEGQFLANNNNAVVISINYRLDIFGFLATQDLLSESGTTGNYGIQDQRKAFQWVQNNVANFGGNPSKVLIFGESAGGISMCIHYISPASKGLFSALIGESPLCAGKLPFTQLPIALNFGNLVTEYLGCNVSTSAARLSCLRSLSTLNALPGSFGPSNPLPPNPPGAPHLPWGFPVFTWMPAVDGASNGLPDEPLNLVKKGQFNDVPIILGTNKNEGSAFIFAAADIAGVKLPLDEQKFQQIAATFWPAPGQASQVLSVYTNGAYGSYDLAAEACLRDYFLACPARAFIREVNEWRTQNGSPNQGKQWMYMFERHYQSGLYPVIGDIHAVELFWVFDHPLTLATWTAEDTALALQIGAYWSAMARGGDPNTAQNCVGCIQWPVNSATPNVTGPQSGDNYIFFKAGLVTGQNLYQNTCDFWDAFGYLA